MEIGPLLRSHGHRLTEPRRIVWEVLSAANRHLTAQQIATRVHDANPGVNLSSVYRSLSLFAELDLIRESNLRGDGVSRWEPAHPDDQFHLVCDRCGDVRHHPDQMVERMRAHLGADHGFEAATIDLVATGTCAACAAGQR
ncbi:MAG: Fur family transcriptional regulator [Acidimicrobiia bacterium]